MKVVPEPPVAVAGLNTSVAEPKLEPFQYLPVETCRIEAVPEATPPASVAVPQTPTFGAQPAFHEAVLYEPPLAGNVIVTVGAVRSTVQVNEVGELVLPPATACTWKVWLPAASPE